MERNVSLEEISDGKRYEGNDLVKADCGDCEGCSACCQGMGSSILLDPYDIKRMEEGLCMDFNQLMAGHIELNVVDHVILPNLKMTGSGEVQFSGRTWQVQHPSVPSRLLQAVSTGKGIRGPFLPVFSADPRMSQGEPDQGQGTQVGGYTGLQVL